MTRREIRLDYPVAQDSQLVSLEQDFVLFYFILLIDRFWEQEEEEGGDVHFGEAEV